MMKTYEEMTAAVFSEGGKRLKEQQKKNKKIKRGVLTCSLCLVFILAAALAFPTVKNVFNGILPVAHGETKPQTDENQINVSNPADENQSSEELTDAQGAASEYPNSAAPSSPALSTVTDNTGNPDPNQTAPAAAEPDTELYGGDGGQVSGGSYGGFCIPCMPFVEGFDFTGEVITDEEAVKYFNDNTDYFTSSLTSSGVNTDGITMSAKGYCRVMYEGTEGKKAEVRQNFRDYFIFNGSGDIIAICTFTKENGVLSPNLAFGAPWFEALKNQLEAHKGEELLFVFPLNIDIILTPDGEAFTLLGHEINTADYFGNDIAAAYKRLYTPEAVYVP